MANIAGLSSFVSELRAARTNLANELAHVDAALAALGRMNGGSNHTKTRHMSAAGRRRISLAQKARWAKTNGQEAATAKPKRTMSASARRKISLAQKARWAKQNGQAPKPKHTMSAEGRKRIAAASRARWAAFRAAKKKAA